MIDTDTNISLDDMRSVWQHLSVTEPGSDSMLRSASMLDHRTKLMRQEKAFVGLCVVWAIISVPMLCLNPVVKLPLWGGLMLVAYFVVMGVMCLAQYYAYKDIDMCTMSVRECLGAVLKAKIMRRKTKIVGALTATPVSAYLLWFFYHVNHVMFAGALAGAVIGLFIGLVVDMRMRRRLRQMARYLESLDHV